MSVEVDLAEAFRNRWLATPALVAAVPGGIFTDQAQDDAARPLPYAILAVALERPQRMLTMGLVALDLRRVSVDLYGVGKAALGDVVSLIHATFDWPVRLSALPAHAWTRNCAEDREGPTPVRRHGAPVRQARVLWVVAQLRTSN